MFGAVRRRLSYANVVSSLCLFAVLGGGAYAASQLEKNSVKSKHIKAGQVKNADLANDAVTSPKVADGSLLRTDFASGQIPAGPRGPAGPAGSPDTPQQVRTKLQQVDGSGSGIDADQLDGLDSGGFPRIAYETTVSWNPPSLSSGTCTSTTLTGMDLQSGDVVVATDESGTRFTTFQVTEFMLFNVDQIVLQGCNNGASPIDQDTMNVSVVVLR